MIPSPLRGGNRLVAIYPTLRIGLISSAPSEQDKALLTCKLITIALICVVAATSCSSRVTFEQPQQYIAATNAININTASADALEKLPKIGPKTAEAIVAFREENGPFRRPEHLMLIRGVSEKRFAEIRQFLRTE